MTKILTNRRVGMVLIAIVLLAPLLIGHAHAQAADEIAEAATNRANRAVAYLINAICFSGGAFLLLSGITSLYQKHKNNNAGTTMSKIGFAFFCGTMLIGFPFLVRTASLSLWNEGPTVTGEQRMMTFDR
ncbi:hypothetical protein PY793_09585 [Acetobacter fabarum]|uniref:hypothetical protein n=1 Tax=Acetobacter fabarum TaxID=483199 RepID=UPI00312B39A5